MLLVITYNIQVFRTLQHKYIVGVLLLILLLILLLLLLLLLVSLAL